MLQQVLESLARGEFKSAGVQAQEVVARYPEMAEAHHLLAISQGALGQYELALSSIAQAIALAPDAMVFHVTQGGLLARSAGIEAAEASLRETVRQNPNAFEAYISLAHLAVSRNDLQEAHQCMARAARLDPDSADVLILRGIEAQSQDRLDEASALFSQAVRKAPGSALAHACLGLCFLLQGYLSFAEQSLRNALQRQPLNRGLRWALLRAVAEQGHGEQALEQLDALIEQVPTDPVAINLRAEYLLKAGRLEEAAAGFTELLYLQPDHPHAISRAVQTYLALGRDQDADELLEARLASNPERDEWWALRLGTIGQNLDAATLITERWYAARPESAQALEAMAQLSELRGQLSEAEAFADRALRLDPNTQAAQLVKLRAELRHDPPAAQARSRRLLERARASDAENSSEARRVALHWYGLALDACGLPEQALAAWQEMWTCVDRSALPLPVSQPDPGVMPGPATSPVILLWSLPGTSTENLLVPLAFTQTHTLMVDRFSNQARLDGLDPFRQVKLESFEIGSYAAWKAGVEAMGYDPAKIVDWIPHWDRALQAQFPEGKLIVLLDDPRDLLLNWLAFGCPQNYRPDDLEMAALWLQHVLQPLLVFRQEYPDRVLLLTSGQVTGDRPGVLARIAGFATVEFAPDAAIARSLAHASGRVRNGFDSGHWRKYEQALKPIFKKIEALADSLNL